MRPWWILHALSLLLVVLLMLCQAQQPSSPTCETQLAQDYRVLVSETLLPAGVSPLPSWQAQLATVVTQIRVLTTHYDAKRVQAEQAERAWAEVREQVRQLQVTNAQLTSELEQARASKEAP